ncbi:lysophospholipid acyltransferase family protein [Asticcacaulis endophyticus]|uniref:Lipid A biosynthesis lauroyl acyltransferase n=1 Tax=Asticcacaulis endophyticus TaxID=1395890 RepID=A0A918UWE1_9CAUL|nr:lysophospholipid acyltransferase family protein [Asticcacaulis endophyticus]GGZ38013.1 lipid A biosynthesis lauroyl acyltransferase [Asticcacaulis endophyticus]
MALKKTTFLQDIGWRIEAVFYDLFVAVIRSLPVDTASDLGGWLLKTFGPLTSVQKTVRRNLDIAFPDQDEAWKRNIVTAQWENLGRTFAEFPIMDRIRISNGRVEVVGGERLEALEQANAPVVFISGHFANWEIMPSTIVDYKVPCLMTYRAANNPYVDQRIKDGRFRYGVRLFAPKGGDGAKDLLLAMGRGESVALMNDQKFNKGVPTPFFDSVVYTAPGPTRLAMRFGTVLQPMSVERTHKARFRVIVHPAIEVDNTGNRGTDIETTVCKVSKFVEDCVLKRPEEWFWAHKRWPKETYKVQTDQN